MNSQRHADRTDAELLVRQHISATGLDYHQLHRLNLLPKEHLVPA